MELAQQKAMPQVSELLGDQLESVLRGIKGVTYKRSGDELPDESVPLTEPDDMVIVASPCHGYEPMKVPENHTGPLYCLICGSKFAV